jgi:hypothetical protein
LTTHKGIDAYDCAMLMTLIIIEALNYSPPENEELDGRTFLDNLM